LRVPRTLKMRRGVYSLLAITRYIASTPPFSSVWQIAGGMVSAFKTPHTSLPRPPFGGVRLKHRRPHRTRRTARRGPRREAAGIRAILTVLTTRGTALAFARWRAGELNGRITMKHFVLSIALSALVIVAASATTQAAYYHHRHHHYWHHGYPVAGYWNYYRTSWPGRGNNEESTR